MPITQTQRPVENGAPDGNRTRVSRISSGVLSQLNYGTVREANLTDAVLSRAQQMLRSANYDGQVVMLTEGLQMAGFEPAPLEIALKRSLAIKLPPPDGGG